MSPFLSLFLSKFGSSVATVFRTYHSRQVDGGVQCIAAISQLCGAAGAARQFQHAFANNNDAGVLRHAYQFQRVPSVSRAIGSCFAS